MKKKTNTKENKNCSKKLQQKKQIFKINLKKNISLINILIYIFFKYLYFSQKLGYYNL